MGKLPELVSEEQNGDLHSRHVGLLELISDGTVVEARNRWAENLKSCAI